VAAADEPLVGAQGKRGRGMKRSYALTLNDQEPEQAELIAFLDEVPKGYRVRVLRAMLLEALEKRERWDRVLKDLRTTLEEMGPWGSS